MDRRYDPHAIEEKWQRTWKERDAYRTPDESDKPKFYALDFFPYPSGDGLSVGHCRNYVPTDAVSRFKRMQGYNVLHPMGWDAFGLPAENYAIKMGVHPRVTTERNIANYHRQMDMVGLSFDWSREVTSCFPDYYRWTQWFFLLLHERGLAYQATGQQWWCPVDKTILANEQVENGRCWRCGTLVTKKDLRQWYFRITDYAQRLLDDLGTIDWPEQIKLMQANWIGRSEGAEVDFALQGRDDALTVFTTRPDTLYGATYMVLAPEHPLVDELTVPEQRDAVVAYQDQARRQSEIERLSTEKEKTGVFTGAFAVNPVNDAPVPIWISDYVLMGYGTGAIMAVPAHDERDFAFATTFEHPDHRGDRPAGRGAGHARGGLHGRRRHGELRPVRRHGRAGRGVRGHRRVARRARRGSQEGQLQAEGLADQPPALLGRADPHGPLREVRHRAGAQGPAPGAPAGSGGLPPHGRRPLAARPRRGLGAHHLSELRRTRRTARPTPWTPSPAPAGTTSASPRRTTRRPRSIPRRPPTGCRSTSTSAAPSTRSCTCCTRASSARSPRTPAI